MNQRSAKEQERHVYMQKLLALYKEFDEALAHLRELARDFAPGSNERFNTQVYLCQRMREQLVKAEQHIPGAFDGLG